MQRAALFLCLLGMFSVSFGEEANAHEPWRNFNKKANEAWKAPTAAPWQNPYNGHPYYGGYYNGASNPYYGYPYYQSYYPYNYGFKYPAAPVAPAAPAVAPHQPYTPAPVPVAPVAPIGHHVPAPVHHAPAPGQVYHGGLVFIGKFEGTCEDKADGLYYIDERSFAYCTGGRKTIQACAGGSANPDYSHFKAGERYQHYEFCSINLAAQLN